MADHAHFSWHRDFEICQGGQHRESDIIVKGQMPKGGGSSVRRSFSIWRAFVTRLWDNDHSWFKKVCFRQAARTTSRRF